MTIADQARAACHDSFRQADAAAASPEHMRIVTETVEAFLGFPVVPVEEGRGAFALLEDRQWVGALAVESIDASVCILVDVVDRDDFSTGSSKEPTRLQLFLIDRPDGEDARVLGPPFNNMAGLGNALEYGIPHEQWTARGVRGELVTCQEARWRNELQG